MSYYLKLARNRPHSAERLTPSSRKKAHWTEEDLSKYFSGLTDAASHLVDNVTRSYLHSRSENQLSSLPELRSTRFFSDTDPLFLDYSTYNPRNMTRRCTNCHRFIEGAPTPELVHVGKYGSDCKSTHHPHPCDFLTKTGPCTYYTVVSSPEKVVSDSLTTEQLQVRDAVRQAEMEKWQQIW